MRSQFLPQVNDVSDADLSYLQNKIDELVRGRAVALSSGRVEAAKVLTRGIVNAQLAKGSRSPYSAIRTIAQLSAEHAHEVGDRGFGHADEMMGVVLGEMRS